MRCLALATLTAAAALAVGATAATSASAQNLDELTVTSRGPHTQTLTDTVSYADLDLTQRADRMRLEHRVSDTAIRLCDELHQDPASLHNMGASCKDVAIRDAMGQVRQAFADARSPDYVNTYGTPTSATVPDNTGPWDVSTTDNGPIPDTPANRALYGGPTSRAGQRTSARGN
jgi:UrcA family protein